MSKASQSCSAQSAIWREREVRDLQTLVKEGKSVYVYGMPTSGLAEILRDACAGLGKKFFKIKFSMLRIGEDEHKESGIASAIIGECDGYYNDQDRKSISGVIKVLRKIIKEYRVVIRIDYFDSFYKIEDVRIVSDLIEQVRSELVDDVSFVVSGCHTPQSQIFSQAGVGVLLGNLEKYPIIPLRGNCVRQFIEKKYGERDFNESKVIDIFEATAGDPKLIECLHNVRWCTDSHGLTENEKRKFQLSVQSFVDMVISVYGTERVPGGTSAVEDVWTGKTLNELTTLGCSELSTIGVLPDGKYKLPGVVVDYMVDAPSRLPSLSLLDESVETVRCENVGVVPETAQDDGGLAGERRAGGQSGLAVGPQGSIITKDNKSGILEVAKAGNGKKQILVVTINGGDHVAYKITHPDQWAFIDGLLKSSNNEDEERQWCPCTGENSTLFKRGSKGGYYKRKMTKGAKDFWDDCVEIRRVKRKIVSVRIRQEHDSGI